MTNQCIFPAVTTQASHVMWFWEPEKARSRALCLQLRVELCEILRLILAQKDICEIPL